jgi:hypothetical protein
MMAVQVCYVLLGSVAVRLPKWHSKFAKFQTNKARCLWQMWVLTAIYSYQYILHATAIEYNFFKKYIKNIKNIYFFSNLLIII